MSGRLATAARRWAKVLLGRSPLIRIEHRCRVEWLGSEYGGWQVAVDRLPAAGAVVYAVGVGEDLSFDRAMIERFGARVWAFDPTPRSVTWVATQEVPEELIFVPVAVLERDGTARFFPPDDPAHVSHSVLAGAGSGRPIEVPARRLATLFAEYGHRRLDVLKLDVEGAEYAILDDLVDGDLRPGQILVEFHHRFRGASVADTRRALRRLRGAGYRVAAVSPRGDEVTLVHVG